MNLATVHYGMKGSVKVSVVQNGRVVREYPAQRNLILNRGLDDIASNLIAENFRWGVAGTGTTATELDSATDTATISAGTVTVSTIGYLNGNSADVGRTFKLDSSGNVYLITAFISTTQCVVTPADTIGPDTFILYNTNQTGLTAESTGGGGSSKRTNTVLTGAPNCQTVTTGNTTLMSRTFDFAAESSPITYNEVGFANTNVVGSNIFSRIKLATGVPVDTGQQLRVLYSLSVAVSPITPQTFATSPIIGWPTATGSFQQTAVPFDFVNTAGGTQSGGNGVDGFDYIPACEPSINGAIQLSTSSAAFGSYGHRIIDGNSTIQGTSLSAYVAGTYTRDKFGTFAVGVANATNWRSFIVAVNIGDGQYSSGPRYIFDTAQTKTSVFTLTLGVRISWGRIL